MEKKNKLTILDYVILIFIKEYITCHQYTPSYQEIADAVDIKSMDCIRRHMERLFEYGALETDLDHYVPNRYRVKGFRLISEDDDRLLPVEDSMIGNVDDPTLNNIIHRKEPMFIEENEKSE